MRKVCFAGIVAAAFITLVMAAISIAQEDKLLDDGEWLTCEGELTRSGDRPAFKITEGDNAGKTYIILENSKLEELEKLVKDSGKKSVEISCDVTRYNKKNYIIITYFPQPGENEEEDEEFPGDDEDEEK